MVSFYHVTTWKKLNNYMKLGYIKPPVRAWKDITSAERFSKQTFRKIILRIKLTKYRPLQGHRNEAVVSDEFVRLRDF